MKKLIAAIAVVGVFAGVALAEVVTSVNIVGYKKHTLVSGRLYLVSSQFENIDSSPVTPESLIGSQLPVGSQLFYWNANKEGGAGYESSQRVDIPFVFTGWNGSVTLNGTRGFWLLAGGPTGITHEVAFLGEVPVQSSFTNVIAEALTMTAYPYTADIAFSNTALYATSQLGDQMFVWDPDANGGLGGYNNYQKIDIPFVFTGWNGGGETLTISQGTGIWYDRAGTGSLTIADARPYQP
ncbi:MAG: hypothetical protein O3C57_00425 [Verrucomicrobia bacterium]|nr:hypothetical protein [Verrucomicrobiota bacterium]